MGRTCPHHTMACPDWDGRPSTVGGNPQIPENIMTKLIIAIAALSFLAVNRMPAKAHCPDGTSYGCTERQAILRLSVTA